MKYDERIHGLMVDSVKHGNWISDACALVGITQQTHYNWIKRGKLGEEPFATYHKHIEAAKAHSIEEMKDVVQDCARKGDWRAASWYLEKKAPDKFGQKVTIDTHDKKTLDQMSEEEIEDFMKEQGWVRAGSISDSDRE